MTETETTLRKAVLIEFLRIATSPNYPTHILSTTDVENEFQRTSLVQYQTGDEDFVGKNLYALAKRGHIWRLKQFGSRVRCWCPIDTVVNAPFQVDNPRRAR